MRGNQKICWEITCEMAADLEPCVGETSFLCWQGGGSVLPWREQVTTRTRCAVPHRSALVCLSLVPAAPPWPGELPVPSRSVGRCVLWLARPGEVRQGCGNTPAPPSGLISVRSLPSPSSHTYFRTVPDRICLGERLIFNVTPTEKFMSKICSSCAKRRTINDWEEGKMHFQTRQNPPPVLP